MTSVLAVLVEVLGGVLIVAAAFALATWLGLLVAGFVLVLLGVRIEMSGSDE